MQHPFPRRESRQTLLFLSLLQKADTTEEMEIIEPSKPEKKKTRKEKKHGASPDDEEGDGDRLHEERNGEQKGSKKVRS